MSNNPFGMLSSRPAFGPNPGGVDPRQFSNIGLAPMTGVPGMRGSMPLPTVGAPQMMGLGSRLNPQLPATPDIIPGMTMDEYGSAPEEQSEGWNDPMIQKLLVGGLGAAAGWMDASNYNQRQKAWGDKKKSVAAKYGLAQGGQVGCGCAEGGLSRYVAGGSKGQADEVPAMLSDGEYVFDADTVAALGDGNNAAGASALDKMRENIRAHKRKASPKKIPPKAKAPEQYLKKGK